MNVPITKTNTFSLNKKEKDNLLFALESIAYCKKGSCEYIHSLNKLAYKFLPERILNILLEQKSSISPLPYILAQDNLIGSFLNMVSKYLYIS